MQILKALIALSIAASLTAADAKGGASSGGGGHSSGGGGHSSSSSGGSRGGFSSSPSSRPAPAPTVAAPARPPNVQAAPAPRPGTTTTTTTTVNTSSRNVSSAGNYGGMGPGYYHNDGLLTGLIIGNMMHPQNTVVYAGGGAHNGNALLYPDGRVVNQQGQQIGTYQNGQFAETPNGPVVAQPIPQSALKPVEKETTVGEYFLGFMLVLAVVILIIFLFGLIL